MKKPRTHRLLLRLIFLGLGVFVSAWSIYMWPDLWRNRGRLDIALQLLNGYTFRSRDLQENVISSLRLNNAREEDPEAARAQAVILLYFAELEASYLDGASGDEKSSAAASAVVDSLTLNPSDSFLWLNLYMLRSAGGAAPDNVELLQQSYATGPREGWVAISRNRRALAVVPFLKTLGQNMAMSEFAALVEAGLTDAARLSLTGVGWAHRERLLAALEQVDLSARETFDRALRANGFDVQVPGIADPTQPWRRN